MPITRSADALPAGVIAFALASFAFFKGDALYMGLWYYAVVPLVILGICASLRTAPLFLSGASLAIAITILSIMSVNWHRTRPEGLLGLGHLFSLPGAIVGVLLAGALSKRKSVLTPFSAFLFGFGGLLGGYFANQFVVCNTVMWCGPFSLPLR